MIHVKDELLANYIQRFLQMPQYGVNTWPFLVGEMLSAS